MPGVKAGHFALSRSMKGQTMEEEYLGDGLVASIEGEAIKLRAPRSEGDHVIYLEPEILYNFVVYLSQYKQLKAIVKVALEKNA